MHVMQPLGERRVIPNGLRAVFFDVDGVLLDSLPQHLRFCEDKAREYGLRELQMPSVETFRQMVRRGVSASPMLNFFLAVGFPAPLASRGVRDYQLQFMSHYRPDKFPGTDAMLERLTDEGLSLGLVTSNIRANVEPALSDTMRFFDHRCMYFFDHFPEPQDKPWCLTEGTRILELTPEQCLYVGDQPADAAAAITAGQSFLGVSYGWGLPLDDAPFPIVDSVSAIADQLLAAPGGQRCRHLTHGQIE
jgi:phosphoglycolate phosphatase-like HAD superfamily hydrolase